MVVLGWLCWDGMCVMGVMNLMGKWRSREMENEITVEGSRPFELPKR